MKFNLSSRFTAERSAARMRKHTAGIVSATLLSCYLFCGSTSPQTCTEPKQNDHTEAAVVGTVVVIAAGTAILIAVHHAHHTVKGCVSQGASGLEVVTEDGSKHYALQGETTNLKVGDIVKMHGNKVKQKKGDTGFQTFQVQKLSKDYGACKATAGSPLQPVPAASTHE